MFLTAMMLVSCRSPSKAAVETHDRGENGIWLRRHWLHGGPEVDKREEELVSALVESSRAAGITRLYPFLGPMNEAGHPGWRSDEGVQVYEEERVGRFFESMETTGPELEVMPWTGGVWNRDVLLGDTGRIQGFLAHVKRVRELGADGIHINVEPMPPGTPGFLELLQGAKQAVGEEGVLSVAAYPPTTPLHPFHDVHWDLAFLAEVCEIADEVVVMGYDTALTERTVYRGLVAEWTASIADVLPGPAGGGCKWLMGVPAYEDDEAWHRPDIETMDEAIRGVNDAFKTKAPPANFLGVAVYASWTTDQAEWAYYDRLWRGRDKPELKPFPDFSDP